MKITFETEQEFRYFKTELKSLLMREDLSIKV